MFRNVARGTALFLGAFSLLNSVGGLVADGFDATLWWLDLRFLPRPVALGFTSLFGLLAVAWGLRPACAPWRARATDLALLVAVSVAVGNTVFYYAGLQSGLFRPGIGVPLSLVLAFFLGALYLLRPRRPPDTGRSAGVLGVWVAVCAWSLSFPLLQMILFGKTNYVRPADVVIVFGAGVHVDGTMSQALFDRTRTGVLLAREGVARWLLFSGGPGPGRVHETEAMRRYARARGIAADRILLDPKGLSTKDTVENTVRLLRAWEAPGKSAPPRAHTVLAVSHFYHLPRIKLTYARAGQEVYTVPAEETVPLRNLPWYMMREIAALWAYYLRLI